MNSFPDSVPLKRGLLAKFYDLGQGDAVKRLYWAQRRAQESGGTVDAQPTVSLQRKYVVLPVPEHVEPDGTVKEANNQVVEVVQFVEEVAKPREEPVHMQLNSPTTEESKAQRAEIRKLVEQVQRAVRAGTIRFSPELDRRIREQRRAIAQEIER